MAKKVKYKSIGAPIMNIEPKTENDRIIENREYRFKELLGDDAEQLTIDMLVKSGVDYWDFDALLKKGCEPELAIKILM